MDIFDWYFKQIVTQSQMDWAFDRVQDSLHSVSLDNDFVGIVEALDAQQHAPTPDKTIDVVGPGVAYDPEGQRCYVGDALSVVDCSQDEFGTSSDPPTVGFERYISVFVRFKRNLTEPALDGNNVVVYTKQLESFEFFVRLGAEAAPATAIPAPLMADAVLVCDILVTHGFTAILNADFDLSRRQDWVRFTGAVLGDRVYGTSKEAVDDLLAVIESWGGALPFAFSSAWFGATPVAGPTPPPTTIQEALDAVVYDLAQTGLAPGQGSDLIGTMDYTTMGAYVAWAAASVQAALEAIADAVDGHIGGAPPRHPAAAIVFTPYLYLTSIDVQAAIQEFVDDLANATATSGASRVGNDAYSWIAATTLRAQIREIVDDLAAVGAGTSGASRIGTEPIAGSPESIAASDVMAVLTAVYGHLNARTERAIDELVIGAWEFANGQIFPNRTRSSENLKFTDNPYFHGQLGGTNPPGTGAGVAMLDYFTLGDWSHPWSLWNEKALGGALALVDICVAFHPTYNYRRVVCLNAGGSAYRFDPLDLVTAPVSFSVIGNFGAGTWFPEAMCCDGQYIYVLAFDSGATTHKVQAFDVFTGAVKAGWPATGTLLPGAGLSITALGNSLAARIRVVAGLGASPYTLVTLNPWVKCTSANSACMTELNADTGAISNSGAGDCTFGGPPHFWPSGGLCSDGTNIYAVFKDASSNAIAVVSAQIGALNTGSGKANMPSTISLTDDCLEIVNDGRVLWVPLRGGDIHIYELLDEKWHQKIATSGASALKFAAVDGLNIWLNDRETTDDSQLLWQIPMERLIAKTGGQTFIGVVKDWANLLQSDEFNVSTPPTWDRMGRVAFDGDSIWAILDWGDTAPLSGIVRRIPRAGVR